MFVTLKYVIVIIAKLLQYMYLIVKKFKIDLNNQVVFFVSEN